MKVVCANGIEIKCKSIFIGSLIMCVSPNSRFIDVIIWANAPDLAIVLDVFNQTIADDFASCILLFVVFNKYCYLDFFEDQKDTNYRNYILCPTCIEKHYGQQDAIIEQHKIHQYHKDDLFPVNVSNPNTKIFQKKGDTK